MKIEKVKLGDGGEGTSGPVLKKKRSENNCHQCHRSNKTIILRCSNNNCQKRYCTICVSNWYPAIIPWTPFNLTPSLVPCPSCRNICNCGACLQSAVAASKIQESGNASLNGQIRENSVLDLYIPYFIKGRPVLVDNVLSETCGLSWEPCVLERAFRISRRGENSLDVVNCRNWSEEKIHAHEFFQGYKGICKGRGQPKILRLENWPSSGLFREQLPCHYAEVMRCLPLKHHGYQGAGCLNMAIQLTKLCVSYGPSEEGSQGGAFTKLQSAVSDRVTILMHVGDNLQESSGSVDSSSAGLVDSKVGSVWDLFVKEDIPKLEEFLRKHFMEFNHVLPMHQTPHPVQQNVYLTAEHMRKLKNEYGIEPRTFMQKLGDAVFVPAGCHYQMKNMKSCIHVDVDFSLEKVSECNCSRDEPQPSTFNGKVSLRILKKKAREDIPEASGNCNQSGPVKGASLRMLKRKAREEIPEASGNQSGTGKGVSLRMMKRNIRASNEIAGTSENVNGPAW